MNYYNIYNLFINIIEKFLIKFIISKIINYKIYIDFINFYFNINKLYY
jgi:hypothetical protein